MKLAFITPGTGNYYCGVCMRDNSLARNLIDAGHEVTMLPTYLPHFLDEENVAEEQPIFFGGINVYLQHKFSLFRHTPEWLDKALDCKWLLRKASERSGMTSSKDLGEITISTFKAENGPLAKEVKKVVDWFKQHENPDVILLSTILLAGLGRVLKQELEVPVYGFLQGEDSFLDSLLPEYRNVAMELLRSDASDLDGFITPSKYFGEQMSGKLNLPKDRLHHLPNGITLDGYSPAKEPPKKLSLGFLARQCPIKGLDLLVDAYLEIMDRGNFGELELHVAGGMTEDDESYVEEQKKKLRSAGFIQKAFFHPNISRDSKIAFLKKLTLFSVPARFPEAFGLYVLEALAAGIPVVLPREGAFPEIVEATSAGELYEPNEPKALADALEKTLSNPKEAHAMGLRGHEKVISLFSNEKLAKQLVEDILANHGSKD